MIDKPWIPYIASSFLDNILDSSMTVFEYGSGGSTLYFSQKVKKVISVEHDKEWYDKVKPLLKNNVVYHLIEYQSDVIGDNKANPDHYTSSPFMANFKDYVSIIDDYNNLDIIFIDGRSRASCLKHAAKRIKSNGWIILDNVERDYYLENTQHYFKGWETALFFGCGPHITWPWQTLFMKKKINV
jgi:predicted O-methyltransferase YrrM